jgi:hypothetical protein
LSLGNIDCIHRDWLRAGRMPRVKADCNSIVPSAGAPAQCQLTSRLD